MLTVTAIHSKNQRDEDERTNLRRGNNPHTERNGGTTALPYFGNRLVSIGYKWLV